MLLANRQNSLPKGHALHPEVSILTVPSPSISALKKPHSTLVMYTKCLHTVVRYFAENVHISVSLKRFF